MIFHGFSQNISNLQPLYHAIIKKTPYAVLAIEYQGFGKNEPVAINASTFTEDSDNALSYLKNRKEIRPQNISVLGYSFGGYTASLLSSKNPNLEKLILLSSIVSIGNNYLKPEKAFKRQLPKFISFLYKYMSFLMHPITRSLNTIKYLKKTKVPVDIIYSAHDKMIGKTASEKLTKSCNNLNSVNIIPTGGHRIDNNKTETIISILNKSV